MSSSSTTMNTPAPTTTGDGAEPTIVLSEWMATTVPKRNVMDAILAEELNELSLNEREMISDEIHGVDTLAIIETPELIKEKLSDMERALLEMHHHRHQHPLHNPPRYDQDQVTTIGGDASRSYSHSHSHHGFPSTTEVDAFNELDFLSQSR